MAFLDKNGLQRLWTHVGVKFNDYYTKNDVNEIVSNIEIDGDFVEEENIISWEKIDEITLQDTSPLRYEPAPDDIPKVFIDGVIPTTKDEVFAELTYISKTLSFHSYIIIKCQGTSSMKYPKKNFTIKMYSDKEHTKKFKIDFKGWGLQYKFNLKANWIDISHSRNVVSAQLGGDIVRTRANYNELPELLRTSPNLGMVDGFIIKVYNNGIYQGRYTWNIPKDAWMANMDDELDNHCILCGENYDGGCFRSLPLIDGSDWSDEIHDAAPQSIKTRWTEVVSFIMNSSDEEFKANIDSYIDLQSLIDYHVTCMYICGSDSYGKNQIYLTYDALKWYASLYDLDTTWGMYWNGETIVNYDYPREKFEDRIQGRQGNLLFERIEQNFYQELQSRWEELKQSALSMSNIINRFERFTDAVTSDLIKEDYASTTANGAYSGIPSVAKNNIQQIRNFAAARREWTDEYFNSLTPVVRIPCTGITLSASTLIFDGAGTQTLIATVEPADTTDKIIWTSNNEEVATVNKGVVTAVFNGETTITATCGDYSATCAITVSGIDEPEVDEGLVYQLPGPTTFTGSNYIDTGVAPLAEDKPFTIFLDWTHTGESEFVGSKYVIAHAMTENAPYPGIILQYNINGIVSEYRQGTNTISSNSTGGLIENADLHRVKVVYRKDENEKITVARCYNENGQIHKNEKTMEFYAVPEELRLGCYRSNVGGTGRFAKGLLNDCKIYNYAVSDEEMNALLTASTFQAGLKLIACLSQKFENDNLKRGKLNGLFR